MDSSLILPIVLLTSLSVLWVQRYGMPAHSVLQDYNTGWWEDHKEFLRLEASLSVSPLRHSLMSLLTTRRKGFLFSWTSPTSVYLEKGLISSLLKYSLSISLFSLNFETTETRMGFDTKFFAQGSPPKPLLVSPRC